METYFRVYDKTLALKKEHNLNLLSLLILSKIADWELKKRTCYMTNGQFADYFDVSEKSVALAIKKLKDEKLIGSKLSVADRGWKRELWIISQENEIST